MIMFNLFGTGMREIRTLEDWVYCVKGMKCYDADEESREKASEAVKAAAEELERTRPQREMEKAVEEMKQYSQLGSIYLTSEKPSDIRMGCEFARKARKGLTEIGLLFMKDPAEYKRLEQLTGELITKVAVVEAKKYGGSK